MTYKAYIDNIKAKTGKGPEYFQKLAKQKGLEKHAELVGWDMVTLTRSFFTSRTLNSPERSLRKTQSEKKTENSLALALVPESCFECAG